MKERSALEKIVCFLIVGTSASNILDLMFRKNRLDFFAILYILVTCVIITISIITVNVKNKKPLYITLISLFGVIYFISVVSKINSFYEVNIPKDIFFTLIKDMILNQIVIIYIALLVFLLVTYNRHMQRLNNEKAKKNDNNDF